MTVYDVPEGVAGGEREEGKVGEGWVEKEKIVLSDYNTRVSNIV